MTPVFIFNRTDKSYLNASDLTRINDNIRLLSDIANANIVTKEWNIGDLPRISDYQLILDNINNLRQLFFLKRSTPQTPERPLNTADKWNNIELILHDMYFMYVNNEKNKYYCGNEISCGEEIGVI